MKVVLVALPWSALHRPSAALGALAPYLRRECPGAVVECRFAYMNTARRIGQAFYEFLSELAHDAGELLYAALYYPERRAAVKDYMSKLLAERKSGLDDKLFIDRSIFGRVTSWEQVFEQVLTLLERQIDELAAEVAKNFDVVGMTTCFGQLYGNLLLSKKAKALSPSLKTVLGGSTVSGSVGPSLMGEYPFVDFIVQGEGELPLAAIVRSVQHGQAVADDLKGILTRTNYAANAFGVDLWEVPNMDALPLPDFHGYSEVADELGLAWFVSVEGSRGCWWDRGKRTGNVKATCYFCNLNVQWNGYREKSIARLADEVKQLSDEYENSSVFFLDNIIRTQGVDELGKALLSHGKEYVTFYELRANLSPYELLCMEEAGLRFVQYGIESLSTSYLKRIGKGTTTIQNLQAMKSCQELGIWNNANLIIHFPGSLESEVREQCEVILNYALAYQPMRTATFHLGLGSTVDYLASEFGATNITNALFWKVGLPDDVFKRLVLFDRSCDYPKVDWTPLKQAIEQWRKVWGRALGTQMRQVLFYVDGGNHLRIGDSRSGKLRTTLLEGLEREIYLECMEIKSLNALIATFGEARAGELRAFLDLAVAAKLMFEEGGKYLSLAPAFTRDAAAKRIRAAHERSLEKKPARKAARPEAAVKEELVRLPVV
jgi:ribosomal peptide maturation radical SAM protein 1